MKREGFLEHLPSFLTFSLKTEAVVSSDLLVALLLAELYYVNGTFQHPDVV